jgi:dihydroneopterin triphosphate diphosphatase
VLPWRRGARGFEVAVFHRTDYDVWQFVSGGGEDGETPEVAARREGHEEARIPLAAPYLRLDTVASVPACWFRAWPRWPAHILVVPEYAFAVDTGDHEPRLSDEHHTLRWCSRDEAMDLLRFDSNRTALWELHERLFPGERVKRRAYR